MVMRSLLGLLLVLTLALTGCGADGGRARDASTPTDAPAPPDLLTLVAQPDVGGEVDPRARSLERPDDVAAFTASFTDGRMGVALDDALATVDVPAGQVAAGAVVAVGCETPTDVDVEVTAQGVLVSAPPAKGTVQCLVPVTTVAVVSADPAAL